MNARINTELADFMTKITRTLIAHDHAQGITDKIRKADVLRYYRETKQAFLNLGGLLIGQTDGWFYLFNTQEELVGIDRIPI